MRTRTVLIILAVLTSFLVATYHVRCQYVFQHVLSDLYISFGDFPESYTTALNASRTNGDALIDLDYIASFGSPTIPRIIHFIYFADLYHLHDGSPTLPTASRSHAPELCRKFNPSYTVRIWNETEAQSLIEDEYPWFFPTYTAYTHPIQRVDALKYFVLYHFGGVYMDLDIACRRPLDPLLQFPAWFPEASPLGVNNDLMASAPRHPVLLNMTSALAHRNWNLLFPYLTIFWSTGPQFASDILKAWWWENGARMGEHDTASFRVLPQLFYSEEYTFFGHSPGGTWHGGDVAVVLWLLDRPWVLVCVLVSCLALMVRIMKSVRPRTVGVKYEQVEEGILRGE
ncbi:glycosyltransferase family 32 protein [Plenodomus tracheiphilus IPT5]|uniref:Glycosyltransferase family 32 protein n=1 Tax=Plenodomus tracheiphilus IPT5 TaxID=1408161 RepID=A0A6A7ALU3_9PLEO|nr:glycosyltransferase family 32 protein [Plenodomus tracheiphilus IPT5]